VGLSSGDHEGWRGALSHDFPVFGACRAYRHLLAFEIEVSSEFLFLYVCHPFGEALDDRDLVSERMALFPLSIGWSHTLNGAFHFGESAHHRG
jgi:hypothetical protein